MKLFAKTLLILGFVFFSIFTKYSSILAMSSASYNIGFDSLNGGGQEDGGSASYKAIDTIGDNAVGDSLGALYFSRAGYRLADSSSTFFLAPPPPVPPVPVPIVVGGVPPPMPSLTPPIIANIQIINITANTATITWTTDQLTNSFVSFGKTMVYEIGTIGNAIPTMMHSVTIVGLDPYTSYKLKISSQNSSSGLIATYTGIAFNTIGLVVMPAISNIHVINITENSATITWDTNAFTTSQIQYGLTPMLGLSESNSTLVMSHSINIFGLVNNTTIHFIVHSVDALSQSVLSSDKTFTTLPDKTPTANVTNLTIIPGDAMLKLTWTNPAEIDFAKVKIYRKLGAFPMAPGDGMLIYEGNAITYVDAGLVNGTNYYYAVYAYDLSNNVSSGALALSSPFGKMEPVKPLEKLPVKMPIIPAGEKPYTPIMPEIRSEIPAGNPTLPANPANEEVKPIIISPGETSKSIILPSTEIKTATTVGELRATFVSDSGVDLAITANAEVGAIQGSTIRVTVPFTYVPEGTSEARVALAGSLYSLQKNENNTAYTGTFTVPSGLKNAITVSIKLNDGNYIAKTYTLISQAGILLQKQTITGLSGEPIPNVKIEIYKFEKNAWVKYSDSDKTNLNGILVKYVRPGLYYIKTKTENSTEFISGTINVSLNVINYKAKLLLLPKEIIVPANANILQKISATVQNAVENLSYAGQVLRSVVDSEPVQQVNSVLAPFAFTISVASAASSLSLFNLLAFMQGMLTQPLFLIYRKKRKHWGIVYNSLSKIPIELAIVRLIDSKTKRILQSKVTDKMGRYFFMVHKGDYMIEVVKPGYAFPSQYLLTAKEDVELVDLYHAEIIEITEDNTIARNIPIDPELRVETPKNILFKSFFNNFKYVLTAIGPIAGTIILFITPSWLNLALLLFQLSGLIIFRRIGRPKKPKSWGRTYDTKTHKALNKVVVRIFDKKFNKLLETQITDNDGKFGFFVKENEYYITAEKAHYIKKILPDIDLRGKKEAVINQNLGLDPIIAG